MTHAMRTLAVLFGTVVVGAIACSTKNEQMVSQDEPVQTRNPEQLVKNQKSTTTGLAALRKLFESKSFDAVHAKKTASLSSVEKEAIQRRWKNHRLLDVCRGEVLDSGSAAIASALFDADSGQLVLALWDEKAQQMLEVGTDVGIEDFFGDTERCHFFSRLNSREQLQRRIEEYPPGDKEIVEWELLKCTTKNEDIDLQVSFGCDLGSDAKSFKPTWLCLSTSLQYNNWDCYAYDRVQKKLRVVYAQATAD